MSEDLMALIKKLREETGAGVMDCKRALEDLGDYDKALQSLKEKGIAKAAKKEGREVVEGLIETYLHANGKVGAMVKVVCETDFVARTPEFKRFCHEVAMQVAACDPPSVEALLEQEYIREPGQKVSTLLAELIGKLGENIKISNIARFKIGL